MTKVQATSAVQNKEADIKFLEVMSKIQGADLDRALEQEHLDSQNARAGVELATSVSKHLNEMEREKISEREEREKRNERNEKNEET